MYKDSTFGTNIWIQITEYIYTNLWGIRAGKRISLPVFFSACLADEYKNKL